VWDTPGAIDSLVFSASGGVTTITWGPPVDPGGTPAAVLRYDLISSGDPKDFVAHAVCLLTDSALTSYDDTSVPPSGTLTVYLARASNRCGDGSAGYGRNGLPREARSCP
jgi:hypothetical protein